MSRVFPLYYTKPDSRQTPTMGHRDGENSHGCAHLVPGTTDRIRRVVRLTKVLYPSIRLWENSVVVCGVKGKGGKQREVSVFAGREQAVLDTIAGKQPDEHVFETNIDRIQRL